MRIHSLTTRFLLTLLLAIAVPFAAFGWVVRGLAEQRLEQQAVVLLRKQAADAADRLRARLREIYQGCEVLATDAYEALGGGDAKSFEERLDYRPAIANDLDLVVLADGHGRVLSYRPNPALDARTRAARLQLRPERVTDQEWFRRVRAEGVVWQDRHLSPFLHQTLERRSRDPAEYSLGLALAVPTDERGSYGAVYVLIQWQKIQELLDRTVHFLRDELGWESAEMFLCDGERAVLAHSRRDAYGQPLAPRSLAAAAATVEGHADVSFVAPSGEARWAGLAAVGFAPLEWRVGVEVSHADLFATNRAFGRNLLVLTALIVAVLAGWAMVASRAVVRPVRRLVAATERIAQGDLAARVPARGRHELAELGRAFNRMAEDLAHSRERLAHAERRAAWAEMARQVAHEIKNPLTPMRMSAQLLRRVLREGDPRAPEIAERLARTVLEQTEALDRIAAQFRQFAGPPSRDPEHLAADDLLEDARAHLAGLAEAREGIELVFSPGAPGAMVHADRQEIRRVFLNLVHNACAACDGRGRIELSSRVEGDAVVFRVADDGAGVAEEIRGRLFDPYFTTRSAGTGLGLAICRRILEAHGGAIRLEESRPGRTVFRFELPCARP